LKSIRPIVTVLAVAAIAFGIYYFLFPPPEKVIRRRIARLAEAISAQPKGNIATVANVNRIGSFFHPNVSITVEGFGAEFGSIQGRGELQQLALSARQRVGAVSVEFFNIQVQPGPEKTNATASATALIKIGNENNPATQEIQFQFEKLGRDWLIRSAAPQQKSLKPE
jgi:hypothetical protein